MGRKCVPFVSIKPKHKQKHVDKRHLYVLDIDKIYSKNSPKHDIIIGFFEGELDWVTLRQKNEKE